MKYTIDDLAAGKCAVINDGTLKELRRVIKKAFPEDRTRVDGNSTYYFADGISYCWWSDAISNMPKQSVKDFLEPEFVLPEFWYIEVDKDNLQMLGEWRSSGPIGEMSNDIPNPKGYILSTRFTKGFYQHYPPVGYTQISTKQFVKYVLPAEPIPLNKFPFKLSEEQGKRILLETCTEWRENLATLWAKDFLLNGCTYVSEDLYRSGRSQNLNAKLKVILDDIFGPDESKHIYADGDPVWVKNFKNENWSFRYTTGKIFSDNVLQCYANQAKSGNVFNTWVNHKPAPGVVPPKD